MKQLKYAFTLIELVFVIVIIGILSKFGVELLMNTYENFIVTTVENRLQSQSEAAVTQIASRLQYRIKDTAIARWGTGANFRGLNDANGSETILEWIGYDIDNFRGNFVGTRYTPNWSGFIDVDSVTGSITNLDSPGSSSTNSNAIIQAIRPDLSSTAFNNSAIFFLGSTVDPINDFGYDNSQPAMGTQNFAMHRINSGAAVTDIIPHPSAGNFTNIDISELYQLSWTAYALVVQPYTNTVGNSENRLLLYYDYQPWEGEGYLSGTAETIMEHIDTFGFRSVGDMIKIQICTTDAGIFQEGAYAVCKEKTIF